MQGFELYGANGENRTRDLLITNQLLYQLSYIGISAYRTLESPCKTI